MKKTFCILIASLSLAFVSCNSSTEKCQYSNMISTTYNFNKNASSKIVSIDSLSGCFTAGRKMNGDKLEKVLIKNTKSDFEIIANFSPKKEFEVIRGEKRNTIDEKNAYYLNVEIIKDTLLVEILPTEYTPDNILKFGTRYKFFN